MLHIAFDASRISVRERTGTERYSYELLAALARIDRHNRYWLYTNGLPAVLPPLGPNMALRSLAMPRLWTHLALGPATALKRPDVLFVPAHVIPLIHPRRCVVTIHDLGYLAFPQAHTRRRRLELDLTTRWSIRAAQQVIAISGATRDALVQHYEADPAKITVVYHGLSSSFRPASAEAIGQMRERYGLSERYFAYVGTLQPRKNLERLIEAFAQLADHELQLVIAGKQGWLSEAIHQKVQALGAGGRVRMIGYVPDAELPALLSGALAFTFPSLYEGFGLPVLEAMACGTPVLTSTTSSLPEVAGAAALLVDPTDTLAIRAALARLSSEAELRHHLRDQGLRRAAQFSWERCAQETLAVLTSSGANDQQLTPRPSR
jgi:glycosyltransferase involved in cell wall biosynthesis